MAAFRPLLFYCAAFLLAGSAHAQRKFDFARDSFAFANDTLWAYSIDAQGNLHIRQRARPPEYSRRCFVLCRAAIEFYRFVRFDPGSPKLSDAEYLRRIRHVCRIPVWFPPREHVVIPGYADLRSFSKAYQRVLEQELGNWWPSYFRVGNWRMALPFPRIWQKKLANQLAARLDKGAIQAVFMTSFRPLNHCVIAYDYKRTPGGIRFQVYDPNTSKAPSTLTFDRESSSFLFGRTTYFNGGAVNCFEAYVAPWK